MQINQRHNLFHCSRDFVNTSSRYLPAPLAERFGAQTIRLTSERHVETGKRLSRERITDLWGNIDIFAKIMEALGLRVTLDEVKKKVILEGPNEFNQANELRAVFGLQQRPEKRHLSPFLIGLP